MGWSVTMLETLFILAIILFALVDIVPAPQADKTNKDDDPTLN